MADPFDGFSGAAHPRDAGSPFRAGQRLPGGTVTFLFTDIEGSTVRWERQPEAMGAPSPVTTRCSERRFRSTDVAGASCVPGRLGARDGRS